MLAEPFDPFTMMIERPIPKVALTTHSIVKEEEEEEEQELEKTIVSIQKDKEIDREEILERLRKNKIWITYCDIPLSYTQDSQYISDYELEKEDYYNSSDSDSDDASASLESDTDKDSSEEEESIAEEEESEIASLEEEYDLETATKNTEFDEDIIFRAIQHDEGVYSLLPKQFQSDLPYPNSSPAVDALPDRRRPHSLKPAKSERASV
jgi:hypothetical protein